MKVAPILVAGFLIAALLLAEIIYQLISGKLLARGWRVFAKREQNPMLFWSSIALQMVVVLIVVYAIYLAALRAKS